MAPRRYGDTELITTGLEGGEGGEEVSTCMSSIAANDLRFKACVCGKSKAY
jgi:hypothetical protein